MDQQGVRTLSDALRNVPGISLQAVTSADAPPAGMSPSTRTPSDPLVAVTGGATGQLSIHGAVYAPSSYLDYVATTATRAQLSGGLVVGRIRLGAAPGVGSLVIAP